MAVTPVDNNANRQIARSAGKVMVALLISGLVVNLASIIITATTFGASAQMDAFNAANRVSETLFNLMAGGALGSAFIPTFTGLLTRGDRGKAWKVASAVANLLLVGSIGAACLAALFAQPLVRYVLAPGFADNPEKFTLTVNMLRIMLPTVAIFGISGLFMGILNSHQSFFIPALTPAMYRLGMIFGVVFLTPTMGIYGLAWGVLVGSCMHLALQVPSLLRLKGKFSPTFGLHIPEVREVGVLMLPRVFGQAVVQLNFWVNTILASSMADGSLAGLTWGFNLMLLAEAIIAQSVATAAMPTLSAQYALGKVDELRNTLSTSLRGILLLAIPASLGMLLLRQPIVALMMQYGNFTAASTQLISWALLWYSAGLVGHCIVEIMARTFYAMHDTKTPVLVGAAAMGINVGLSLLLTGWFTRLGWLPLGGLALANSLATGLEAAALWVFMRRRLGGLEGKKVLKGTGQAALAAVAMLLVLLGWLGLTQQRQAWLAGGGGVLVGGMVYGLVVLALKVPEVQALLSLLKRRINPAVK